MGLTSPRDSYFLVNFGVSGSCRSPAKLPSFAWPGRVSSTSLRAGSDPPLPSPSRSLQTITCLRALLWALLDLEFFCCGQASAVDRVCGGYFGYCVHVQVIGSKWQVFSKRNFELVGVLLQREMLIADCGGASGWIHGQSDKGEIEILFSLVGYLDCALQPAAIDPGFPAPFHYQGGDNVEGKFSFALLRRLAAIGYGHHEVETVDFGGRSGQVAIGSQVDPWRRRTGGHFPLKRKDTAVRLQLEVIRLPYKPLGKGRGLDHDGLTDGPGLLRHGYRRTEQKERQQSRFAEFQIHAALDGTDKTCSFSL